MRGSLATDPKSGQLLIGQPNAGYEPKTMSGDATIDKDGVITIGGGGGAVTGSGTAKKLPVWSTASELTDSSIDEDLTTPDTVTIAKSLVVPEHSAIGDDAVVDLNGVPTALSVKATFGTSDAVAIQAIVEYNPTVAIVGSQAYYGEIDFNIDGVLAGGDNINVADFEVYNSSDTAKAIWGVLTCYAENDGAAPSGQITGISVGALLSGTGNADKMTMLEIGPNNPGGTGVAAVAEGIRIEQQQGTQSFAIRSVATNLSDFAGPVAVPTFRAHIVYSAAGTPLPSAVTEGVGARAFVSDATVSVFAGAYVSGGANKVPVYSDGAVWRIG